jgi:hypothetical protein
LSQPPPLRQALCQAFGPAVVDVLLVSRAARSRPAPLAIFPILLHVAFLRLPFLTIRRAPMPSGLAVAQRFAIQCPGCARHQRRAPTRGRMPGAAPDRRAWKQVSATARDQRALPDRNAVSQLRPDLHGRADAMPRCPDAREIIARPRTPKSIPPPNAGALGGWPSSGAVFKRSFGVSRL